MIVFHVGQIVTYRSSFGPMRCLVVSVPTHDDERYTLQRLSDGVIIRAFEVFILEVK